MYWNGKVGSLWDWMLPKVPTALKNASNKNCTGDNYSPPFHTTSPILLPHYTIIYPAHLEQDWGVSALMDTMGNPIRRVVGPFLSVQHHYFSSFHHIFISPFRITLSFTHHYFSLGRSVPVLVRLKKIWGSLPSRGRPRERYFRKKIVIQKYRYAQYQWKISI